jgi:hypothetical protein
MRREYKERLDKMLEATGGFYIFEDIVEMIHSGQMQSFADGDNWVVTQVHKFPRKTVLDIVLVIGEMDAVLAMEDKLVAYKEEVGADVIIATGRLGWSKTHPDNWKPVSVNFVRH